MTPDATEITVTPLVETTLTMHVVAEDTETETLASLPAVPGPVPPTPELSDFGQQAEELFLAWADAHLTDVRAEWDERIGTLNGQRTGSERKRINDNLDAGMLACRRLAAQAVLASFPAARSSLAIEHAAYGIETVPEPAWTAPLPAIQGLPRHGHRRHGGAA